MNEVRCPKCQKKVAEKLDGKAGFKCPRCGMKFTLDTTLTNSK